MFLVVSEICLFWGNIKTFAPPDKNPGYATGLMTLSTKALIKSLPGRQTYLWLRKQLVEF